MGKTILISSHILPELQDLCNTVGIIEQGELIYSGPWTEIVRKARGGMVLHVGVGEGQQEQAAALLSQDPNIANVNANNGYMEVCLKDGIDDYSFVAPAPDRRRLQPHAAEGRRSQPRNRVHAADEGDGAVK